MPRFSLFPLLALLALGMRATVCAADGTNPSMATVDMKQIFAVHPKTKEAEAQINAERNAAKKVTDDGEAKARQLRLEIKELDADLAEGKLGSTAQEQTVALRKEKAVQLQILGAQLEAWREESTQELQKSSIQMRDAILDAINADIAKTPDLGAASFVLDKSGPSMNAVPFVLYSNASLDLSGAVQKQMGIANAEVMKDARAGDGLAVAVVDAKRVFEAYIKTREAGEKINAVRSAAAREVQERLTAAQAVNEAIRKLDTQLADPAISEADRKARTQELGAKALELQKMEQEIAEFGAAREKQIQEQYVGMRDAIAEDIYRVITEGVKVEGRVDLIFDASGTSLDGAPILLRCQGVADWTEALIAKLNSSKVSANRVQVAWAGGTTSTAKLRFAVVDLQRVVDALPAAKAAKEAVAQASAGVKAAVEGGADLRAKQQEIEELAAARKAEIVEGVRKQLQMTAVKAGAQVVFDASGHSLNGVPVVAVHKGVPDLSNEIIAALGGTAP